MVVVVGKMVVVMVVVVMLVVVIVVLSFAYYLIYLIIWCDFCLNAMQSKFCIVFLKVACMQFINIAVHSVEDMNYRVHLQHEFTLLHLDEYLNVSIQMYSLIKQLCVFLVSCFFYYCSYLNFLSFRYRKNWKIIWFSNPILWILFNRHRLLYSKLSTDV